jgi:hypothetical protein
MMRLDFRTQTGEDRSAHKAEALIKEGLRQLQQSSTGHSERDDIVFGLSILRMIKRDRLGHPDWH